MPAPDAPAGRQYSKAWISAACSSSASLPWNAVGRVEHVARPNVRSAGSAVNSATLARTAIIRPAWTGSSSVLVDLVEQGLRRTARRRRRGRLRGRDQAAVLARPGGRQLRGLGQHTGAGGEPTALRRPGRRPARAGRRRRRPCRGSPWRRARPQLDHARGSRPRGQGRVHAPSVRPCARCRRRTGPAGAGTAPLEPELDQAGRLGPFGRARRQPPAASAAGRDQVEVAGGVGRRDQEPELRLGREVSRPGARSAPRGGGRPGSARRRGSTRSAA